MPLQTEKMDVPADKSPAISAVEKQRNDNVRHSIETPPVKDDLSGLSDAEIERVLAERKAERIRKKKFLSVAMERGAVAHRLHVQLPNDMYGEWVRDDPLEIDRLKELGFKVDTEYALKRSLHNDGSGSPKVADVIFMTCPRETKDIIDEIRAEEARDKHLPRKNQAEETGFMEQTRRDSGGVVPTFSEGNAREARKHDIAAALNNMNKT